MKLDKILITLACRIERRIERSQRRNDEAYLAQAADLADLERRQHELARPRVSIPYYG